VDEVLDRARVAIQEAREEATGAPGHRLAVSA
jgi:hypothetical protein